jgi:rRNA-processing protein CGR1
MKIAGKQWHAPKKAFRPGSGLTSYEKRARARVEQAATKAKEREMKEEKEAERKVRSPRRAGTVDHRLLTLAFAETDTSS